MPLNYPASGGKDFAKCSPGLHLAICNLVADIGLQAGSGKFPDPKRKLYLRFEVPGERIEYEKDGVTKEGPMTIGTYFTASMNAKALLRKALENWRGKKFTDQEAELFDVSSILGKPCQIQVMHSDDGKYANIANILPAPKGCKEKAENPTLFYSTEQDQQYDKLPKWLQEKIDGQLGEATPSTTANSTTTSTNKSKSASERAAMEPSHVPDDFADEIPF